MPVIKGTTQFTYETDEKHTIGKQITLRDVKAIQAGHGGYICIIPKCTVDDKTYHILCDTFWQKNEQSGIVVGDLGVGVKMNERPYDVLYNGITKKLPSWTEVLRFQMEAGNTEMYSIEYLHTKRKNVRYAIIIMVDITPFLRTLDQVLDTTKDIRDLKGYEEIERSILSTTNLSYGLEYYREYIMCYCACQQNAQK